jgi:membrane-associated phospholipid phosphatase
MRGTVNRSYMAFATSLLRKRSIFFVTAALLTWSLTTATAIAQDAGPSLTWASSDSAASDAAASDVSEAVPGIPPEADPGIPQSNTSGPGATKDPDISWKHFPMRILEDQKDLWLFPTQLARGKHWVPTLAITGVTGVLIATDPHTQPYFRNSAPFDEFADVFSTTNTGIVEIGVPVVVYVTGLLRHDSYTVQTAMLIGEAYLDSAIPHVVIKLLSRRLRPSAVPPQQDFRDTFFRRHVGVLGKGSSFPSGHAAAAFSIATVMARRYGDHKWVPWVAYGVAGLISFSRVPDMAHFPSDVFLGAALGYTITRFDVFRDRNR